MSYTTKVDNTTAVLADHINSPQDAIVAIQEKLGIDSSSTNSTIDYFLKNASGAYRTHNHSGSSNDGSASIGPLTGITIANNVDVGDYQVRMKQLYADVSTGTAPLVIASTTVVSNLNADKVDGLDSGDIVQMTGNQTIAGDKTFSGNTTLANGSQMASSAAPTADSDIANKKYVDDNKVTLGSWSSKSANTVYQATTDGFFVGYVQESSSAGYTLQVKTDSAATPTTVRQYIGTGNSEENVANRKSFCVPVKENDYYLATLSGTTTTTAFYFIPLS